MAGDYMTQDYKNVAFALKELLGTIWEKDYKAIRTWNECVIAVVNGLSTDNPRFARDRFFNLCSVNTIPVGRR